MRTITLTLLFTINLFGKDTLECEHYKIEAEKGLQVLEKRPYGMNSYDTYILKSNLRKTYNHCRGIYPEEWLDTIKKEFTKLDKVAEQ